MTDTEQVLELVHYLYVESGGVSAPPAGDVAGIVRQHIRTLEARIEELEALCSAAYQVVGAEDGPVEMLDNLSDAASGDPIRHDPRAGLPHDSNVMRLEAQRDEAVGALRWIKEACDVPGFCTHCGRSTGTRAIFHHSREALARIESNEG